MALILVTVPASIGVIAAMTVPEWRGTLIGGGLYAFGKVWLALFPITWGLLMMGQRLHVTPPRMRDVRLGVLTGAMISVSIALAWLLIGRDLIDESTLRDVVRRNGLTTVWRFVALAMFLSVINAVIEEYVWRWFAYTNARAIVGAVPGMLIAAGLFTVHHVIALKAQLNWTPALLASVGVFLGGVIWSVQRDVTGTIWSSAVSHFIVDVAIFTIGGVMIFG